MYPLNGFQKEKERLKEDESALSTKTLVAGKTSKKVAYFIFDDLASLIERFSLMIDDVLPTYFALPAGKTVDLGNKDVLKVDLIDVRDELRKVGIGTLAEPEFVSDIQTRYKHISAEDIGCIWLQYHMEALDKISKDVNILNTFRSLDRMIFTTIDKVKKRVKEYAERVTQVRKILKDKVDHIVALYTQLSKVKPVVTQDIVVEEIKNVISFTGGDLLDYSLIDLFDSFDVNEDIPFALFRSSADGKAKTFYKVYSQFVPFDEWINYNPGNDGLHFYVNTSPSSDTGSLNSYTRAVWRGDMKIEMTFSTKSAARERVAEILSTNLKNRVTLGKASFFEEGVNCVFRVLDVGFVRSIFCDMIYNHPIVKNFFFLNESEITALQKADFFSYFVSSETSPRLTIRLTPHNEIIADKSMYTIDVRVSQGENVSQVYAFKNIFAVVLGIFEKEKKSISKMFSSLIDNYSDEPDAASLVVKQDKKTGIRAIRLRQQDPNLFEARYPDQCQQRQQPYHLSTDEKDKFLDSLSGKDKEHKVINFPFGSDDWYACEPREPTDASKGYVWPGLKPNTSSNEEYKEQHPYLPCCYQQDHYKKQNSSLKAYLASHGEGEVSAGKKKSVSAHIVGRSKAMNVADRLGRIPLHWERLLSTIKFPIIKRGKEEIPPLLRYSVMRSPDNFLHCFERAFNVRYIGLDEDGRKEKIMEVREELARMVSGDEVNYQEFYGMSRESIIVLLKEERAYLDVSMFGSLACKYYSEKYLKGEQLELFVTLCPTGNSEGEIALPRHSQAYLPLIHKDNGKHGLLIFKYEVSYGYQCDVGVFHEKYEERVSQKFILSADIPHEEELLKIITRIWRDANEVYVVTQEEISILPPIVV